MKILERIRLDFESSQMDDGLQNTMETCDEQYKAIKITTEWIYVCVVHWPGAISIVSYSYLLFFLFPERCSKVRRENPAR